MKEVLSVIAAPSPHWVGDGFPVRTLFSYNSHARELSPFLMLDYAGPYHFDPTSTPRGVGTHPHRGFETVTIVYEGEVAHRDSHGHGGVIGPGDVQWMTAASGILHEEFHSPAFTRTGGMLEMVQLWVNLPARHKMDEPRYQAILDGDIPAVDLPGNKGAIRIIAGHYKGHDGPALTFSPMNVWDMRLNAGADIRIPLPNGWTVGLLVVRGSITLNEAYKADHAQMAVLGRDGQGLSIKAEADAIVLLLSGDPINEPVVGHGPFVMNTQQEIMDTMEDYKSGKFGQIAS